MRKIIRLFVAAFLLIASLSAFSDTPKYGGVAVVAITSDPGGLNPAITTQGGVTTIGGSIFNGLVSQDFDLNPVPDLALKWEISTDGRTYTFHLAPNAVFHDGVPLTSADVKFTFENMLLKFHSRTRTAIGDNLDQILTPNAHTVTFKFKKPYAAFLALIDVTNAAVLPKHLYENSDPLTNPFNIKPVGSGPFKFGTWAKGDRITLLRNENYFKSGKPYLDKVIYKVMPNAATAAIGFENGEADLFFTPAPLDVVRFQKMPGVTVTDAGREAGAGVETVVLNLKNKALSDVRVRRAITHAVDKQYIVDKAIFGKATVATGPISYQLKWVYNPNVTIYKYDIESAEKLLDDAGFKRGSDGVRFKLKAVYAPQYAKVFEIMHDQLGKAGIKLELNQVEFGAMVDMTYIKKDFDVSISSFENGSDPDIGVKRTLVSSNIGPIPFSNGSGYKNKRVDELFDLAAAETDRKKRAAYYFEIQDIVAKEVPYLWLYSGHGETAYKKELQGVFDRNAKSTTYFAQDAWWLNGTRQTFAASSKFDQRRMYFFVAIGAAVLALVGFMALKRKRRKT